MSDTAADFVVPAAAAGTGDGPVEAPPWRPDLGPAPTVMVWPPKYLPALLVRAGGRWRLPAAQQTVRRTDRVPRPTSRSRLTS
ncbi:hypothetical protein ACFH04_07255 [Streptomyces noboritoensis]|uniref:Uncharacterized protein n=1 Tax=Streptomyces noboritoensis TaxID=67337 RepID=A0ABV6TCL8_9ACTN